VRPVASPRLELVFSILRTFLLSLVLSLGTLALKAAASPSFEGPGVRDVVEFTQIVQPVNQDDEALNDQISPDGSHAFIVTRKADVASDTNLYELKLLDLRPASVAADTAPSPVAVLSAKVGGDVRFTDPSVKLVHWHGDRTLVFLARLDGLSPQVYTLDILTRKLTRLTAASDLIVSYAESQDLRRVVYAVIAPNPPLQAGAHDVVVGNQSFWSVEFGQGDVRAQQRKYRYFVVDAGGHRAPRALGVPFAESSNAWPTVSISPDGRWAVLPRWEPERVAVWEREYPLVAELSGKLSLARKIDPLGYFVNASNYAPRRMIAWHLDDGKEETIVDAPDDASVGLSQSRPRVLWQGSGESLVLAGTHLPAGKDGRASPASHLIEYWPARRQWNDIAALTARVENAYATPDGFYVIDGDKRRDFERSSAGGWRESTGATASHVPADPVRRLHTIQEPNRPPDVYAVGRGGEPKRLTHLNPQFDPNTWGTMKPYSWRDAQGQTWDGGLMSAAGMDASTRYPLVIQTYGFDPTRFYLSGPNEVDGAGGAYAGRAFLRHGILVLALPYSATNDAGGEQPQASLKKFDEGVRSAVEALVKDGRVDPSKVGIIGWSATGERVAHLLTFGDMPLRAATMADADADTLFSYTITYGRIDTTWNRKEQTNEGLPFGEGLAAWVRNDPSLHTDCIRTPLRIETYGRNVGNNWDFQALLRRQYKPAEMIVIPTGVHALGGPGNRMASLQGNVDWFGFWLAGRARAEPLAAWETRASVAAQFARWRQMETLKVADDARPPCKR
jgi:dipeptidyl aminopeptidase/acylaminoacyl peptidase